MSIEVSFINLFAPFKIVYTFYITINCILRKIYQIGVVICLKIIMKLIKKEYIEKKKILILSNFSFMILKVSIRFNLIFHANLFFII